MLHREVARETARKCSECYGAGLCQAVGVDPESACYNQSDDDHSFQEVEDARDGLEDRGLRCTVKAEEGDCRPMAAAEPASRDDYV